MECKKVEKQFEDDFGKHLQRLGARDIAFLLYAFKLIDEDTYLGMRNVTAEKNKMVHPTRKGIDWRYVKPKNTATKLLQEAKEIIRKIRRIKITSE